MVVDFTLLSYNVITAKANCCEIQKRQEIEEDYEK